MATVKVTLVHNSVTREIVSTQEDTIATQEVESPPPTAVTKAETETVVAKEEAKEESEKETVTEEAKEETIAPLVEPAVAPPVEIPPPEEVALSVEVVADNVNIIGVDFGDWVCHSTRLLLIEWRGRAPSNGESSLIQEMNVKYFRMSAVSSFTVQPRMSQWW